MHPLTLTAALLIGLTACGDSKPARVQDTALTVARGGGLTAFEQENGIGPIKETVVVGPLDEKMAEAGEEVFEQKCSACHKLGEKYVGPALRGITERRTAAYIMNMILNPQEMVERHPVAKQLLAEHMSFMPNQGLTPDEARLVLEYLREKADRRTGGQADR